MKLSSLLKNVDVVRTINYKNINISNLSIKANQIEKNGLFFAISGNNFDGANFIFEAIKCGARAVVTEKEIKGIFIPQIIVKDIRLALTVISKTFFNKCDEKLKIIMVVGTNGKTTTSTIIYNILKENGEKVGLIGTNGVLINDLSLPNVLTTPDPIDLFYIFEQMVSFGVKYVVMEVSAHAIYYKKVYGIEPNIVVFTNISNEHLDFFKTMDNYSNTKLNFVRAFKKAIKVVNVDDDYGLKLLDETNLFTYGLNNPADAFAIDINLDMMGCKFLCNVNDDIINIASHLTGDYNVYNLLASISVAKVLKIQSSIIIQAIEKLQKIDGRWEVFDFPNNNKVVIDYAHTPDGFKKVLTTVKQFRQGRIITLFGCVGYSDKVKRRLMGDIAQKYSDFVVITSDNFTEENFEEIADDIGVSKYYAKIKNRAKAVEFSINMLDKNDTLLLLGKGVENTQKSSAGDTEYNEVEFVKNILESVNIG